MEDKPVFKEIKAPDGAYLTQAELAEGDVRVFIRKLVIAADANAESWRTATAGEKQEHDKAVAVWAERVAQGIDGSTNYPV